MNITYFLWEDGDDPNWTSINKALSKIEGKARIFEVETNNDMYCVGVGSLDYTPEEVQAYWEAEAQYLL